MKISNRFGAMGALLVSAAMFAWAGPSAASPVASACLKGVSANKLCLDILESVPASAVQPSGLAGTKTFVKYSLAIRNLVAATSRNVVLDFTVSPTPAAPMSFEAETGVACSVNGATLSCLADKLDGADPLSLTLVAEAPQYPATVTQMVGTGVIGWNGNTATTSHSVAVSNTAGDSYVPADTRVTLATNDSDEVTPESPLYARVTLPPQPDAYRATVTIVTDAPANANCISGIYLTIVDGPFVCRDTEFPRRGIRVEFGDALFTSADPAIYLQKWDASIVPATQLPPNLVAPSGTPPFAVFGVEKEDAGGPTASYGAISALCGPEAGPPCLTGVQQLADGDWVAESRRVTPAAEAARQWTPLAPLQAMLDLIISRAEAQTIPKPKIGNSTLM